MGTLKETVEIHLGDTLMKLEDSGVLESTELVGLDGIFTKFKDYLDFLIQANSRSDPAAEEKEYDNFAHFVLGIADSLDRFIIDVSTQLASDSDAVSREIVCMESDMKEGMRMASRLGGGSRGGRYANRPDLKQRPRPNILTQS